MPKLIRKYQCMICEEEYDTLIEAKHCEARPTPKPKYKIGDTLRVTTGEGAGHDAIVSRVFYYSPRRYAEEHAHAVGYDAGLIGTWGSRRLIEGVSCK